MFSYTPLKIKLNAKDENNIIENNIKSTPIYKLIFIVVLT
jgi:hypothetical protein